MCKARKVTESIKKYGMTKIGNSPFLVKDTDQTAK